MIEKNTPSYSAALLAEEAADSTGITEVESPLAKSITIPDLTRVPFDIPTGPGLETSPEVATPVSSTDSASAKIKAESLAKAKAVKKELPTGENGEDPDKSSDVTEVESPPSPSQPLPNWNDPIMALSPDTPIETRIVLRMLETESPDPEIKSLWKQMRIPRTMVPLDGEEVWDAWERTARSPEEVEKVWRAIYGDDVPVMTTYEMRAIIRRVNERVMRKWVENSPFPSLTDCYDPVRGRYWRRAGKETWNSYNTSQYRQRLCRIGRFAAKGPGGAPSEVDSDVEAVTERQATVTEGISGLPIGLHPIDGRLYLTRYGYKMIEADPSIAPFKTLLWLREMLGDDGMHRAIDWLHHAVSGLAAGRREQSRILAIAGPAGCGKSHFIREIARQLLGGRAADAAPWLLGTTEFAAELGSAELLYVDDALGDGRLTTRLGVASKQKQIVTAGSKPQAMHAEGRDRYYHPVWWRHAVALNDTAEALAMLPPLDDGYSDKLILLRARASVLSAGGDGATNYIDAIQAELPGFMAYILAHGCRGASDGRGPLAWQDPELAGKLRETAPEYSLAGMIAEVVEHGDVVGTIKRPIINPTLTELDRALRATCGERYSRTCPTDRVTLRYLGRLKREGAVKSKILDGRTRWNLESIESWLQSHHTLTPE